MGAAQSLQETSAQAARELLGAAGPTATAGVSIAGSDTLTTGVRGPQDASTAGWRAPFRWDGDVCRIVDQRRLPDTLVDIEIRSASDGVRAISDGALVGSAVQAQVAAVTLALVAARAAASRAYARRATIRGAANAFRVTRPGSAAVAAALDRMLALVEAADLETPGEVLAATLHDEAERIIGEAVDDHGSLVGHLVGALPGGPADPIHVLVAGSSGAMGGGQFGTALSAVQTVHHAGRPIHALVTEGRPAFEGSRIAAWELRQAGVPHAVVTDGAAPGCIAAGEVDAALVAADRVAANGDVVLTAGGYPLALACAAAGVPFLVCAPTSSVDPGVADGGEATIEEGRPTLVMRVGDTRVMAEGTQVRNPLQEVVPAALVTAIATEEGVLHAPFGPALATALQRAMARREGVPGIAALRAQREAAGAAAGEAGEAAPGSSAVRPVVDVAAMRNRPREGTA